MRWLLSLLLGLNIAWLILYLATNKTVSTFTLDPMDIKTMEDSLVGVGLAQYPQVPSIMDSIDKPVPFSYGPAPNLNIIQGSSPSPDFSPATSSAPSPAAPAAPVSMPMADVSSPSSSYGFNSPSPSPAPAPSVAQVVSSPSPSPSA